MSDSQKKSITIEDVENIILTRLYPHIYAFSTETLPGYLKIGDTLRGVDTRIAEWRRKIAEKLHLESVKLTEEYRCSALLSDDIYFRDYSVHDYLKKHGKTVLPDDLRKLYSEEFFAETSVQDVEAAVQAIIDDFNSGEIAKTYQYYSVKENKSTTLHGANDKEWKLRPNQEEVVKTFREKSAERELLMYAVMRFGKSFTAMYCAKDSDAKKVLIVSAKADVAGEWKKTVETPVCFKDYTFLTDEDLLKGVTIDECLSRDKKNRVALFLTLQNLTGKTAEGANIPKKRLQQVFTTEFDLIIVDETHYGAWANSYGKPLKDADEDIIEEEREDYKKFSDRVSKLHYKKKLHLSGTPYNLLYDNKFNSDNIIATCQFKDILREKAAWDEEYFYKIENGEINPDTGKPYQEFDNPYFGFPQMLRFAFNLPLATRQTLEKAKYNWSLNDLFETTVSGGVASFVYEQDVLNLLKAVDGSKQADGVLSFLDIPKIKDNDVCKHMVFVLPRKYACDAMENLLLRHASEFNHLGAYKVLNITGHTLKPHLDSVDKVKAYISQCEKTNPPTKTVTLTVYKMLTGVTVKEWDTIFMLKNTRSAQEYDQAAFRVQNQYVEECRSQDGGIMKIDKKPQTILVDFDPVRMFTLQGLSSRIVEHVTNGGTTLGESIDEELKFFPIITYNADELVKVGATDLIELITQYNNNKSIMDSVQAVMLDRGLLSEDALLQYIRSQSPTSAKNSLDAPAHESEDTSDIQTPQTEPGETEGSGSGYNGTGAQSGENDSFDKDLERKYRMCIARLAFYAFLTETNIDGLQDIIDSLKETCREYKENKKIFRNLELNYDFIVGLQAHLSRFYSLNVDDALKRANLLSKDEKLPPEERALNAIKNFNRFSESEVVTPNNICNEMVGCIGKEKLVAMLQNGDKILDVAGKAGEFAFAIYKLLKGCVEDEVLKNGIYTIPTSGTAYEFTKRIYRVLGLNTANIATPQKLTSYDLLKVKKEVKKTRIIDYERIKLILTQKKDFCDIAWNDGITEGETDMINFGAVVGNPPYQKTLENTSDAQIYNYFMDISYKVSSNVVLITPAKFLFNAGKTPKEWNQKMLSDEYLRVVLYEQDAKKIFSDTNMSGALAITQRDLNNKCGAIGIFNAYAEVNTIKTKVLTTDGFVPIKEAIVLQNKFNLQVLLDEHPELKSKIGSGGKEKRIVSSAFENLSAIFTENQTEQNAIKIIGKDRVERFISAKYLASHLNLYKYKVVLSAADGASGNLGNPIPARIIGKTFIAEPNVGFTQTFLSIGAFDDKAEAENLNKYLLSKFARFMISTLKATNGLKYEIWSNVPLQDFTANSDIDWSKSVADIDRQLYAKYGFTKEEIAFIESMIKPME